MIDKLYFKCKRKTTFLWEEKKINCTSTELHLETKSYKKTTW